jgi:amino acid adenylation domain-containing protein
MSIVARPQAAARPDIDEVTSHVRELVADLLESCVERVEVDVPLVALGLESFVAVRLRRQLHDDFGCKIPLNAFLGEATIADVATLVAGSSAAGLDETESPRSHVTVLPTDGSHGRTDRTFDLTPIQAAYLAGREPVFPLGGVATFYYTEFDRIPVADPRVDIEHLTVAWNRLVHRHGMLRAVMIEQRQRILGSVPEYRIEALDLRDHAEDSVAHRLEEVREERSHQLRPADRWPLFDLFAVLLPDGRTRLCCGFDVLALDLRSWMQVLEEWGRLVAGETDLPALPYTFADLVESRAQSPELARRRSLDEAYWRSRNLPDGPSLPWTKSLSEIREHRFARHTERLPAAVWRKLQSQARLHGLSSTGLLLGAFGFTLQRWGADEAFSLNTTLFDRDDIAFGADDAGVAHVVGDFTSTVLVAVDRIDPRTWRGFAGYAAAVNRTFWEAMEHRTVAGVSVRDPGDRQVDPATGLPLPTHPVVFTSGLGLADESYSTWLGDEVFGISQTPQVLLDHIVRTADGDLLIDWDHVVGALPPGFLPGMAAAHTRLLCRLAESAELWTDAVLGWIPSYEPDPAPRVEGAFGGCGPLLDDPWLSVAAGRPDARALTRGGVGLSYGDLSRMTARNAEVLACRGLGSGDLIGVLADKGLAQVAAALSVLRTGAAYVPIETGWPDRRVASVIEQAGIRHVLQAQSQQLDPNADWRRSVTIHPLDDAGVLHADASERAEPIRGTDDELAYVIFTSGSTGRPKGVAIEHRAARTTLDDLDVRFPLDANDCLLGLSAFSFDLSVYDIFSILGSGGRLVLPEVAGQRDPGHWLDLIAEHRVTVWNTAPALLEMLVEYGEIDPDATRRALADLRLVLLSADWIPVNLPDRLRRFAPRAEVVSLGGATEASIWSICFPIHEVDPSWPSIPYGRALAGQFFHILDGEGRPCPVGADGELYIGGDGLAREYVGNPTETLARFVENPVLGRRLYRTGDLGRWRPDGTIQFLGRADRQVKIRGHRIELSEIDSTLEQVPGLRHALARAVQGPDARPRLVAYVWAAPDALLDDDALIDALEARLPAYMVPNHFVWMDRLPVTENGKIDYRSLPSPYDSSIKSEAARGRDEGVPAPPAERPTEGVRSGSGVGAAPDLTPPPSTPSALRHTDVTAVLGAALAEAVEAGFELRVILDRGALDPVQALSRAASWTEQVRERLQGVGPKVATRIPVHGLIEIAVSGADGDTPSPLGPSAPTEPLTSADRGEQFGATADKGDRDPMVEREVARVFSDLLGGPVNVETPFFRLGATSLTVVNAHRRLRESLDPSLTVVELFAHPTVRGTAAVISGRTHGTPSQPPEPATRPANPQGRAGRLAARERARRVVQ